MIIGLVSLVYPSKAIVEEGVDDSTYLPVVSSGIQEDTSWCVTAITEAIYCDEVTACPAVLVDGSTVQLHCTRDWNQELNWQTSGTSFGHCVDPTGQVAAAAAIQADLCTLPDAARRGKGVPYRLPPNGHLLIDDPDGDGYGLRVTRRVILEGAGVTLEVDTSEVNTAALQIWTDQSESPVTNAIGSTVRDLSLYPSMTTSSNDTTGILVQAAQVGLQNIRVQHFGKCIFADGDDDKNTNANHQFWSRLYIGNCWSEGIVMIGSDVQAGLIEQVFFSGGVGGHDNSTAGNTWIAPSTELANPTLRLVGNPTSTVIGMEIEVGDPAPTGGTNSTWIGGNAISKLDGNESRVGLGRSRLTFRNALSDQAGGVGGEINIPGQSPWSIFEFRHDRDCPGYPSCTDLQGDWRLRFDDLGGNRFYISDAAAPGVPHPLEWVSP